MQFEPVHKQAATLALRKLCSLISAVSCNLEDLYNPPTDAVDPDP